MQFPWTDDIIETICARLASGESIHGMAGKDGLPSEPTIYRYMAQNEAFRAKADEARRAQQEYEADYCVQIADEAAPEEAQVAKLRIWARQWRASKLAPKKYGDRITQDMNHSGEITTRAVNMSEREIIERYKQQQEQVNGHSIPQITGVAGTQTSGGETRD